MNSLKFLHFSDIHLDAPFSSLGSKFAAEQRRRDLLEVFGRIIDLAKKEAVDIILISGDLYEHEYVRKSTIHYINKKFSEIPKQKCLLFRETMIRVFPIPITKTLSGAKMSVFCRRTGRKFFLRSTMPVCMVRAFQISMKEQVL